MASEAAAALGFQDLDPVMDNAMSQRDRGRLDSLLASDFIYTHSNGMSQDKAAFIDGVCNRENPPVRRLTEIASELHDDIAVSRGNLDVIYNDGRPSLLFRYVRVYRLTNGDWHPISHRTVYATDREASK
jgi:hypothetical protein